MPLLGLLGEEPAPVGLSADPQNAYKAVLYLLFFFTYFGLDSALIRGR